MSHYRLVLVPRGSLMFGGYTATQSASGSTARDARGLLIPASAIKGALRESAARLVRGVGGVVRDHQGGYPPEEAKDDMVGQLFGHFDIYPGKLRVGPLRAVGEEGGRGLAVRHHVTLERATRQAAQGRLFDIEVTPAAHGLQFEGMIEVLGELSEAEQALFESTVRLTDQVGGGRGHGLGVVRLELKTATGDTEPAVASVTNETAGEETAAIDSGSIVLELVAREPLQLGGVRDAGNLERTDEYLAGTVTRGAVAAVLARTLGEDERDAVLEQVMGGESPACFGVGRVGQGAIPAPTTLREPKGKKVTGAVVDRALDLVLEAFEHKVDPPPADTRAAKGTWRLDDDGWTRRKIPQRLITRSARNPLDGRANAGLLFSIQTLDPDSPDAKVGEQLTFHLPVEGESDQLRHIVAAARHGLMVGGARGRGFGRLGLKRVLPGPSDAMEERHGAWVEALVARGLTRPEAESTGCLLALGFVAVSQGRLNDVLAKHGLNLLGGETRRHHLGGWNTRKNLPRSAAGGFAMGSVFLVKTAGGEPALVALEALEKQGIGPGRADGWGRVMACHPIHCEATSKDKTTLTDTETNDAEGDERSKA